MRTVDRIFGWLMVVAALLHTLGSWLVYRSQHELLLWSLAATLAELYLAGMNLIRAERRHDLVLARLCVAGNLSWLVVVLCFARLIGHFFDARVLVQFVITATLLALSLRARNRSRPM
jgi:hypothetical protein